MNISNVKPHNTRSESDQAVSVPELSWEAEEKELRDQAVRVLKRNIRKYVRRRGILSGAALVDYKLLCNRDITKGMPEADGGKTNVYLPESYPEIVLKESGRYSRLRFVQMYTITNILKEFECSHLIVPRALPVNGFLIEERSPKIHPSF